MNFLNIFRRKKESTPEPPKKEEPMQPTESMPSTTSETSAIPILLGLEKALKEHDNRLIEHDASTSRRLNSLAELIEASKESMLSRLRPSIESTESTPSTSSTLKERLMSLNRNEQLLLELLLNEEYLTYRDIAERTGLNANTVKDIINRSKGELFYKKHDEKGMARVSLSQQLKEAKIK